MTPRGRGRLMNERAYWKLRGKGTRKKKEEREGGTPHTCTLLAGGLCRCVYNVYYTLSNGRVWDADAYSLPAE